MVTAIDIVYCLFLVQPFFADRDICKSCLAVLQVRSRFGFFFTLQQNVLYNE